MRPEVLAEIAITGSRIVRGDGYQAPTPLTVVGAEELQSSGTPNVADFVNTIPAFAGSRMPTATNSSMSGGSSGMNAVNLRSLGLNRTLVLLDGRRSVGSTSDNIVDINLFPQNLISRVDVVTGGASAAYGSDAVAGVVNFILDKQFTGFKADASGGITEYGDTIVWGRETASFSSGSSSGMSRTSGFGSIATQPYSAVSTSIHAVTSRPCTSPSSGTKPSTTRAGNPRSPAIRAAAVAYCSASPIMIGSVTSWARRSAA